MKRKVVFSFLVIIILGSLFHCSNNKKENRLNCKELTDDVGKFFYKYQVLEQEQYLDSIWFISNLVLRSCQDTIFIVKAWFWKLEVLKYKKEYFKAAKTVDSISINLFPSLPYFKEFLKCRFLAMGYRTDGQIVKQDSCLFLIDKMLSDYLEKNKKKMLMLMSKKNFDKILSSPLFLAIVQYYNNRKYLYGYEKVKIEIDSLSKILEMNKELYEILINPDTSDFYFEFF